MSIPNLAWGLGAAGYATPGVLEWVSHALEMGVRRHGRQPASPQPPGALLLPPDALAPLGFNGEELASILSLFSRCDDPLTPRSEALVKAVLADAMEKVEQLSLYALVEIALNTSSLVSRKGHLPAQPKLFLAIAKAALPKLHDAPERELACLAGAFGRTHAGLSPTLFDGLAVEAAGRLGEFSVRGLTHLTWGFARHHRSTDGAYTANKRWASLMEALSEELSGRRAELGGQELASVEASFRKLGHLSPFATTDREGSRHDKEDIALYR